MARRLKRSIRHGILIAGALTVSMAMGVGLGRCSAGSAANVNDKEEASAPPPHLNDTLTNAMSTFASTAALDKAVERYLRRWEIVGAQLAYSRNDTLLYARGYGWADKEKGVPMEPSNIMRIASVSKLVTAVGIMHLQEKGLLSLSDHVFGPDGILNDSAYTAQIRDKRYYSITVEHLLRHSAGFDTRAGDPMFYTRHIMAQNKLKEAPDNDTLLRILLRRRLGYTPGEGRWYSNLGYMLLSMIIERLTGQDYEQYMRDSVLAPAGCYDFHIAGNYYEDRLPNEVKYYPHGGCGLVEEFNNSGKMVVKCYGENDIPRLKGAGGWAASAAELSRLVASIDSCEAVADILSEESVGAMTEEMEDDAFSIGWNRTPVGKPWERTGSMTGTSALVMHYPDGECLILLTNTSTWKGHGFSTDTKQLFARLRRDFSGKMPDVNLFYP